MRKGSTETDKLCISSWDVNFRTFLRYSKHSLIRTHERTVACKTQITAFMISNVDVSNTQATELVGCLSQEASMSDIRCLSSSE